jgi:hypothetical protein
MKDTKPINLIEKFNRSEAKRRRISRRALQNPDE